MTSNQPVPETFGKYQIIECIASGGMAQIFKARLEGIGGFHRTFAIKRILPHLSANSEFVDLLVDEAKVAGLLSHANIVQILDLGRIDDHYFIAMEYVAGYDLGRVLSRCQEKGITIPLPHALFVCIEVLKGLEYAHNRQVMRGGRPVPLNIVHRDLSPPNILLSLQGEIKITDFGIAKASIKAMETLSGIIKGRFDYLSPEQCAGKTVDQRSDIFSIGVVLYEMLVGQHPFKQDNDIATLDAIRNGRYTPPSHVNPDVPYALDIILQRALETDPELRFPSASAFRESLDSFFQEVGFFCTQSTLAAFFKGLFPERRSDNEPPRPKEPQVEQGFIKVEASPISDDDVLPTVIQDVQMPRISPFEPRGMNTEDPPTITGQSSLSSAATLLRRIPDSKVSRDFAQGPLSDAATLIRQNPLLDSGLGDVETQIQRQRSAPADEPSLTVDLSHQTLPVPQPRPGIQEPWAVAPAPRPAPAPSPAPLVPVPAPRRAPEPLPVAQEPAPQITARLSYRAQIIYLVVSVVTLLIGLFSGYAVGLRSGASVQADSNQTAVKFKEEPILEVRLPKEAQLFVDNREVPGESPLTVKLVPGRQHQVKVQASGSAVLEFPVKLDYNQHWIYNVEPKALEPQKKK